MSQRQERAAGELPPMPPASASAEERARGFEMRQAARYGAPTLDDLRRAYASWDETWPGDEEVRRRHVVADPSVT